MTKNIKVVVKPVLHSPKGFINVAQSTDAQLKAALIGTEIEEGVPFNEKKRYSRGQLIGMLRATGLWNFVGDVIPAKYKALYGEKQRCGDEVSEALHSATRNGKGNLDLDALHALQESNGIEGKRWAHCNIGQQVMNTSNVLRARVKRGEEIVIAGITYGGKSE